MPKVMNTPPSLRELQEIWTERITTGAASQDMMSNNVVSFVVGANSPLRGTPTADERLDIYADGWYVRLEESLSEDFPRLKATMKRSVWYRLVEAYLLQHPPTSFTLTRAGDLLPGFLAENREFSPWQADLALLEKALYKVLNAPNVDAWEVSKLLKLAPDVAENLRFEFQGGAALIESEWNVDRYHSKETSVIEDEKAFLVVERDGFTPVYRRASAEEFAFLKEARDGATLGTLVERYQRHDWTTWLVQAASIGTLRPILK